jgi:hypothetical protein
VRDTIKFDDLSVDDQVLIRTRNSTYSLRILDPARRHGVLTGGGVIRGERRVVLFESLDEDVAGSEDRCELRRGSRGLFYLTTSEGLDRLLTSPIMNLILCRAGEQMPAVS